MDAVATPSRHHARERSGLHGPVGKDIVNYVAQASHMAAGNFLQSVLNDPQFFLKTLTLRGCRVLTRSQRRSNQGHSFKDATRQHAVSCLEQQNEDRTQ